MGPHVVSPTVDQPLSQRHFSRLFKQPLNPGFGLELTVLVYLHCHQFQGRLQPKNEQHPR